MKSTKNILQLKIDKNGDVVKNTYRIKKNKQYQLDLDFSKYSIKVEDDKKCRLYEDFSFKVNKSGETKIFFTNKETKEFSYITLKVDNTILWFIIFLILGLILGYLILSIKENQKSTNFDNYIEYPTGTIPNGNSSNNADGVILFPSSVTTIGISDEHPYFEFENNSYNRVFFHYYIYVLDTGETIDVGQVMPGDILETDMTKYFNKGLTDVRIDIRTFKDTKETQERNSMSFNSVIIYK